MRNSTGTPSSSAGFVGRAWEYRYRLGRELICLLEQGKHLFGSTPTRSLTPRQQSTAAAAATVSCVLIFCFMLAVGHAHTWLPTVLILLNLTEFSSLSGRTGLSNPALEAGRMNINQGFSRCIRTLHPNHPVYGTVQLEGWSCSRPLLCSFCRTATSKLCSTSLP